MNISTKPTLAFVTMCKNESHCIRKTLDSVAPYIDYLVVYDTESTDNTVEVVQQFMDETGIPGEIIVKPFIGFGKTKTLMMESVYGKTDYVLHFDADDVLEGDFSFNQTDASYDTYYMTMTKNNANLTYLATVIYNNRLKWKFAGAAHTIIKCIDKPNYTIGTLNKGSVCCDSVGARSFDPEKYLKDANRLTDQFFETLYDDPDGLNARSVFYAAQSYMDYRDYESSLKWYSLYTKLNNTWIEERFESTMRMGMCLMHLGKQKEEVLLYLDNASSIFPDRAEPYYRAGEYLLGIGEYQLAYNYFTKAKACNLNKVKSKYILFILDECYELGCNDNLSVVCSHLNKTEEGIKLILEIIDLPKYAEHKERLTKNLEYFFSLQYAQ